MENTNAMSNSTSPPGQNPRRRNYNRNTRRIFTLSSQGKWNWISIKPKK